ncbi:FMN-binding negative transcriptional regulator [Mesorhizobium sp. M0854]
MTLTSRRTGPSKHEFHNQAPTWNYLVVHAHGHASLSGMMSAMCAVTWRSSLTCMKPRSLPRGRWATRRRTSLTRW